MSFLGAWGSVRWLMDPAGYRVEGPRPGGAVQFYARRKTMLTFLAFTEPGPTIISQCMLPDQQHSDHLTWGSTRTISASQRLSMVVCIPPASTRPTRRCAAPASTPAHSGRGHASSRRTNSLLKLLPCRSPHGASPLPYRTHFLEPLALVRQAQHTHRVHLPSVLHTPPNFNIIPVHSPFALLTITPHSTGTQSRDRIVAPIPYDTQHACCTCQPKLTCL